MQTYSRKRVIGIAAAGGVGTLASVGLASADTPILGHSFKHEQEPQVEVSFPVGWHIRERLIENLVSPQQVLVLSSVALPADPNPDEGFLPDVSVLGDSGILLMVYAESIDRVGRYGRRVPPTPLTLDSFQARDDGDPSVRWWHQWFEGTRFDYTVGLWAGFGADDTTARAVVGSLRLP